MVIKREVEAMLMERGERGRGRRTIVEISEEGSKDEVWVGRPASYDVLDARCLPGSFMGERRKEGEL